MSRGDRALLLAVVFAVCTLSFLLGVQFGQWQSRRPPVVFVPGGVPGTDMHPRPPMTQ